MESNIHKLLEIIYGEKLIHIKKLRIQDATEEDTPLVIHEEDISTSPPPVDSIDEATVTPVTMTGGDVHSTSAIADEVIDERTHKGGDSEIHTEYVYNKLTGSFYRKATKRKRK